QPVQLRAAPGQQRERRAAEQQHRWQRRQQRLGARGAGAHDQGKAGLRIQTFTRALAGSRTWRSTKSSFTSVWSVSPSCATAAAAVAAARPTAETVAV